MITWHEENTARGIRLWEQTRRPAFASLSAINARRTSHGDAALTEAEYEAARTEYYRRYPDAK